MVSFSNFKSIIIPWLQKNKSRHPRTDEQKAYRKEIFNNFQQRSKKWGVDAILAKKELQAKMQTDGYAVAKFWYTATLLNYWIKHNKRQTIMDHLHHFEKPEIDTIITTKLWRETWNAKYQEYRWPLTDTDYHISWRFNITKEIYACIHTPKYHSIIDTIISHIAKNGWKSYNLNDLSTHMTNSYFVDIFIENIKYDVHLWDDTDFFMKDDKIIKQYEHILWELKTYYRNFRKEVYITTWRWLRDAIQRFDYNHTHQDSNVSIWSIDNLYKNFDYMKFCQLCIQRWYSDKIIKILWSYQGYARKNNINIDPHPLIDDIIKNVNNTNCVPSDEHIKWMFAIVDFCKKSKHIPASDTNLITKIMSLWGRWADTMKTILSSSEKISSFLNTQWYDYVRHFPNTNLYTHIFEPDWDSELAQKMIEEWQISYIWNNLKKFSTLNKNINQQLIDAGFVDISTEDM